MDIARISERLLAEGIDHGELHSLALKLMEAGTNQANHFARNVKWLDVIGKNLLTLSIRLKHKDAVAERKKGFCAMLSEVGIELSWLIFVRDKLQESMPFNAFGQVIPELGRLIEQVQEEFCSDC